MVAANDRKATKNVGVFISFSTHQKRQKVRGKKKQAVYMPASTILHQATVSVAGAKELEDNTVFVGIYPFKCGDKFWEERD